MGVPLLGAEHTVPQAPQLEVSLSSVTQDPLQLLWAPQSVPQVPAVHTFPLAQAMAQPPQCAASEAVLTHAPEQFV
jgi:hypothetical protein